MDPIELNKGYAQINSDACHINSFDSNIYLYEQDVVQN